MIAKTLPYYEIADGVFEIEEFECASMFAVVGEEKALLIDTGVGIGDLRWVLENRITDKPYDVVISHAHGDHFGGAGFFDRVYVSRKDADWSLNPHMSSLAFRKEYAAMIAARGGGKHFDYDPDRDIRPWEKEPEKAKEGLDRIIGMKDQYDRIYNGHHDYRGFGQSLFPESLLDARECVGEMLNGTAVYLEVEDQLHPGEKKTVAEHGLIQITCRI